MNEVLGELDPYLHLAMPWVVALVLALTRTGGILLALPHAHSNRLPKEVKGAIAISIASSLVWLGPLPVDIIASSFPELALVNAMIGEMLFGLAIGFLIHLALAAVRFAGEMIGIEMGLSFAAVADPLNQSQSTPAASFLGQLGIQMFLVLGLDRLVVRGLAQSVKSQPLGHASISTFALSDLVTMGTDLFRTGVQIALPVVGAIFALKLAIALLARTSPRIQLFILAFTLTIFLGQIVLSIALPSIGTAVANHLDEAARVILHLATKEP